MLLALVAGQDVEPAEGSDGTDGRWRIAQRVAPDRVISHRRPAGPTRAQDAVSRRQDGFKAHLAIEPDTGIITDCALTKASGTGDDGAPVSEASVGLDLLDGEDEPVTVLADSAYGSGQFRAELGERGHTDRVKPAPSRPAVPGGFTVDDFTVDHDAGAATCPNGVTKKISPSGWATFGAACRLPAAGPLHPQPRGQGTQGSARTTRCNAPSDKPPPTRAGRPNTDNTGRWSNAPSPGWPAVHGNRRVRYRGVIKNNHWLHHRAAALNLRRLVNLGLTRNGTASAPG